MPPERRQARQDGNHDIAPVGDRGRRYRADQQVAGDPAGVAGGEGQHEHPEEVEAMPDAHHGAAQREHEGAEEIERQDERFHGALGPRGRSAERPAGPARACQSPRPVRARLLCARLLMQPALRHRQHDRDDRRHDHQEICAKGEERRFAHRDVVLPPDEGDHARNPVHRRVVAR